MQRGEHEDCGVRNRDGTETCIKVKVKGSRDRHLPTLVRKSVGFQDRDSVLHCYDTVQVTR
jgi:hypothetical protein